MHTPDFHDHLAPGIDDAAYRVKEITAWFLHVNRVQPRLKKLRYEALAQLRAEGLTHPEIADRTGMSKNRVEALVAEINREHRRQSYLLESMVGNGTESDPGNVHTDQDDASDSDDHSQTDRLPSDV